MTEQKLWLTVAIIALVTALIRFLPFIVFANGRQTPKLVEKLGKLLPCAVMAMLVVYCLKDVSFTSPAGFLPAFVAGAVVCSSYVWKRNTLISIASGTVLYMILVQLVF